MNPKETYTHAEMTYCALLGGAVGVYVAYVAVLAINWLAGLLA